MSICLQGNLCISVLGSPLCICFRIILCVSALRTAFVYLLLFRLGMCGILQARYIIFLIFMQLGTADGSILFVLPEYTLFLSD